jgi:hypothetical protein
MGTQSQPSSKEIRARNWARSSFGVAILLNLIAMNVDLDGPLWFTLRTVVLVVFTATLVTFLALRVRRLRALQQDRDGA